jgi:hypothetical protein
LYKNRIFLLDINMLRNHASAGAIVDIKLDELVKSPKTVIPAKAGIHK